MDLPLPERTLRWHRPLSGAHGKNHYPVDCTPLMHLRLTCINPWLFSIRYAKGEVSTEVRGPE